MNDLRVYTLFPGQFLLTSVPALITTVLGSCVSVCLWDDTAHVAGMNHFLLPGTIDGDKGDPNRGLSATRMLVRAMINRQATPGTMEAKVFGGCNSLYREKDMFKVGERNIEVAMQVLEEFKIRVTAQHTGGAHGRKIVFNTASGKVRMRLLKKTFAEINEEINKGFGY